MVGSAPATGAAMKLGAAMNSPPIATTTRMQLSTQRHQC